MRWCEIKCKKKLCEAFIKRKPAHGRLCRTHNKKHFLDRIIVGPEYSKWLLHDITIAKFYKETGVNKLELIFPGELKYYPVTAIKRLNMILSCCFNIHDVKFKLGKSGIIVYIDNNTYMIDSITITLDENLKPQSIDDPPFFFIASRKIVLFEHNKELRPLLKMYREIENKLRELSDLAYHLKRLTGSDSVPHNASKISEETRKRIRELGLPDGIYETRLPFARGVLQNLLDMLEKEIEKLRKQIAEATLFPP